MVANKAVLALCAGLVGAVGCAHDSKPRERASVSAVTNEEVAEDRREQGKTRMQYTQVNNETALGRDNPDNSTLADEPAANTRENANALDQGTSGDMRRAGIAGDAESCELAVYFDTGSSRLDQGSQARLDRVADCMKRKEINHATIVGQTDPSGSKKTNDELALERARAVAEYLRGRGVPEDQIRVRSKGEVASTQSREVWPVERRAGVEVTPR